MAPRLVALACLTCGGVKLVATNDALVCWKCGTSLEIRGRFSRLEACRQCGAELHACIMCMFHDPHHAEACTEERAEPPGVKDRANFCDYFQPRPQAFGGMVTDTNAAARAQLDALFGGQASAPQPAADETHAALEALFKPKE